jgi:hypothetical protein
MIRNLLVAAGVAGALAVGVVGFEGDASARGMRRAPPAMRVEIPRRAPSPRHAWVPGYWGVGVGGDYAWIDGRWDLPRAGFRWEAPRWEHVGREWHMHEGRWARR